MQFENELADTDTLTAIQDDNLALLLQGATT